MSQERELRDCFGRFATGVTVVTCREQSGRPAGITVNSFTSVSLEPRLILWNLSKESRSADSFVNAGEFVVNVLADDQRDLSEHFAQSERPRFEHIDAGDSPSGQPVLPGCIAYFHCQTDAIHEGGDHYIIVGEVSDFEIGRDTAPLLYFASDYRTLAP